MFVEWWAKGREACKMQAAVTASRASESSNIEAEGWLTEGQIRHLYNETEDNCPITEALKRKKLATGQMRLHPEIPDCVEVGLGEGGGHSSSHV